MERVVGRLLNAADPDARAEPEARAEAHRLPATWQQGGFIAAAAELAKAVVALRRKAAAEAPPGLPASVWLDRQESGWRERLPVSVDGGAGRALVDGLMAVRAVRAGGEVSARRAVGLVDGHWTELAVLNLDGRCDGVAEDAAADGWTRLRLFAHGELARHAPGELALLEHEDGAWMATPARPGPPIRAPWRLPLEVQVRGGGDPLGAPILLDPPVRSDVRVFALPDDGAEDGEEGAP